MSYRKGTPRRWNGQPEGVDYWMGGDRLYVQRSYSIGPISLVAISDGVTDETTGAAIQFSRGIVKGPFGKRPDRPGPVFGRQNNQGPDLVELIDIYSDYSPNGRK